MTADLAWNAPVAYVEKSFEHAPCTAARNSSWYWSLRGAGG
jgi:hypothetical protein